MDIDDLLKFTVRVILIIILLMSGYQFNNHINTEKITFDLTANNINWTSVGFYYHENYFCVMTKDREPRDILETTIHELAHLLIETNETHFLERYKEE